eukprot:4656667-Pleurochrysis_carterae.AAC.3
MADLPRDLANMRRQRRRATTFFSHPATSLFSTLCYLLKPMCTLASVQLFSHAAYDDYDRFPDSSRLSFQPRSVL